jgi:hypothetical protein
MTDVTHQPDADNRMQDHKAEIRMGITVLLVLAPRKGASITLNSVSSAIQVKN